MEHHTGEEDTLNEPAAKYHGTIKIFQSHEEAENFAIGNTLEQHPISRIGETVELILRVYGYTQESLRSRNPNNKITFLTRL